jgi:hypothetical protein
LCTRDASEVQPSATLLVQLHQTYNNQLVTGRITEGSGARITINNVQYRHKPSTTNCCENIAKAPLTLPRRLNAPAAIHRFEFCKQTIHYLWKIIHNNKVAVITGHYVNVIIIILISDLWREYIMNGNEKISIHCILFHLVLQEMNDVYSSIEACGCVDLKANGRHTCGVCIWPPPLDLLQSIPTYTSGIFANWLLIVLFLWAEHFNKRLIVASSYEMLPAEERRVAELLHVQSSLQVNVNFSIYDMYLQHQHAGTKLHSSSSTHTACVNCL